MYPYPFMGNGTQHVSDKAEPSLVPYWRVPWEFAVHAIVGTSIFAIVAVWAIGLNLFFQILVEPYKISRVVIDGLQLGEYTVFGIDLFLFVVFLLRTAKRMLKDV